MLEKPDLPDEIILACLQSEYGLHAVQIAFLPIGWQYTAIYRVVAEDSAPYFVKLVRGSFAEAAVAVPKFLSDQGSRHVIAPLVTRSGQLWASLDSCKLILYPFIAGHNGFQVALSESQWVTFGRAVKSIHSAKLPPALMRFVPTETYAPLWRELVKTFLERAVVTFADPVAVEAAAFLRASGEQILDLVRRAERLARALQARSPAFVLCHSDLHAGNLLIDANDALYIVDWDNPVLAPKERDLMFIGGGMLGAGHSIQEQAALFYLGYGQEPVDALALAYFRYERIIEDIAADCELVFLSHEGGAGRAKALRTLRSHFLPESVLEIAYRSDRSGASELHKQ